MLLLHQLKTDIDHILQTNSLLIESDLLIELVNVWLHASIFAI